MGTKIHSGLWLECKVCPHTPEELQQKREKRERPTFKRKRVTAATVDLAVRRQVAYELGGPDAEPTSEQKFQMLQKYGVAAARIDRAISKPKWMSEGLWRTKKAEYFQATKGLVPKDQFKRISQRTPTSNTGAGYSRSHQNNLNSRDSQQKNSNGYRPSYDRGRTANHPR